MEEGATQNVSVAAWTGTKGDFKRVVDAAKSAFKDEFERYAAERQADLDHLNSFIHMDEATKQGRTEEIDKRSARLSEA